VEGVADSKLNKSQHCTHVAKNARDKLGCMSSLASRLREAILPLSSALVRPLLEYCVQLRAAHYKRDVELLERAQRKATQLMKGPEQLP